MSSEEEVEMFLRVAIILTIDRNERMKSVFNFKSARSDYNEILIRQRIIRKFNHDVKNELFAVECMGKMHPERVADILHEYNQKFEPPYSHRYVSTLLATNAFLCEMKMICDDKGIELVVTTSEEAPDSSRDYEIYKKLRKKFDKCIEKNPIRIEVIIDEKITNVLPVFA